MDYKIDCKSVGARIKARKMALQITVNDLEKKSGVPEDTINNIVYGRTADPRIETLARIAMALDTTLDHIVFGTQPTEQSEEAPHTDQIHYDADHYVQSLEETHAREIASIREAHTQHVLDMKETHAREVAAVRDHATEIRRIRDFWRALSCVLTVAVFVMLAWFI